MGQVAGKAVERIRASRPESVIEQLLGNIPGHEGVTVRPVSADRDAVLAATLRCLMAKHYMLDRSAVESRHWRMCRVQLLRVTTAQFRCD
jgi:hypothetical protein